MTDTPFISLSELQSRPLPQEFDTISGPLPYTLLNDLMFRIVFESNQDALKSLLCSLLHLKEDDIVQLEIKNPINLGRHIDEKTCIFDINILLNNKQQIHLELQVLSQPYWTERSLCYLCRNFGKLNAGEDYKQIKPLIQIDILDFELYKNSRKFYSVYHLADDQTGRIYSDKLALHVLELNKEEFATEEDKTYHIDYWARLFKATTWEELKMLAQEHKSLQSTVKTIYHVNAEERLRDELFAREDQLRLQRSYENDMKEQKELIIEQENLISEQNITIHELSDSLQKKDATIASKDAYIAELEAKLGIQNN